MGQEQDSSNKEARPPRKKQAVILVHGIGEQIPMSTLTGFVDAVWCSDASLINSSRADGDTSQVPRVSNPVWAKPDKRINSFELRRITTERMDIEGNTDNNRRTDFYEFYWAHLSYGTTWAQTYGWLLKLLLRAPSRVPLDVRPAWMTIWMVIGLVGALAWWLQPQWEDWSEVKAIAWVGGAILASIQGMLITTVGDVVRYTQPDPLNIARRQEIRQTGITLLETLMGVTPEAIAKNRAKLKAAKHLALQADGKAPEFVPEWDTEYDRIIMVGHSLGTIVAYDVLGHTWARMHTALYGSEKPQPARADLEQYCRDGWIDRDTFDTKTYRAKQRAAFDELQEQGHPWLVSDFVSIAAPLTHAEFLLADSVDDAKRQMDERKLATCPPRMEWDADFLHMTQPDTHKEARVGRSDPSQSKSFADFFFSFRPFDEELKTEVEIQEEARRLAREDHARLPHHAAHFAFTRWTNIFSPSRGFLWGDLVSGPVKNQFGLARPRRLTVPERFRQPRGLLGKLLDALMLILIWSVILIPKVILAWTYALIDFVREKRAARRGEPIKSDAPQPDTPLAGVKDVQVMPEAGERLGSQGGLFPHTKYWDHGTGKYRIEEEANVPHKIKELRKALNLRFAIDEDAE